MPPVSVLIKPVSGKCNLRCGYCFYRNLSELRTQKDCGLMDSETAETVVRRIFEVAEQSVSVMFQGGEPTLAGLSFYRDFIKLVSLYNRRGAAVRYGMQTNGTTIDASWCAFYREHSFQVGVSLDGIPEIHDALRAGNESGHGSFEALLVKVKQLAEYRIPFQILTVVTRQLVPYAAELYDTMQTHRLYDLHVMPCLPEFGLETGANTPAAEEYGAFLVALFRKWARQAQSRPLRIRLFENLARRLQGEPAEMCALKGHCSIQYVIEADGSVYPCDFYCLDPYRLGSVQTNSLRELFASPQASAFLRDSLQKDPRCTDCLYFALCRGGCSRERVNGTPLFCAGYRMLLQEMCRYYSVKLVRR